MTKATAAQTCSSFYVLCIMYVLCIPPSACVGKYIDIRNVRGTEQKKIKKSTKSPDSIKQRISGTIKRVSRCQHTSFRTDLSECKPCVAVTPYQPCNNEVRKLQKITYVWCRVH